MMDGTNETSVFNANPCYKISSFVQTDLSSMLCLLFHIFLGCLAAVTVCGNLLVIISILYFKQLHTPTNALVLSLAVADLLVGAVVFPLTMDYSVSSCMYREHLLCKIRSSCDITLSICSILNLCCISIDRYHAVCQPLTYRARMSSRAIGLMVLVSWVVPAAVAVGLVGFNRVKCVQRCFFTIVLGKILIVFITFYLPLLIMICLYLKIFFVAQKQANSIHSTKTTGRCVSKQESKATKTLAIIMGVFLLCWLPSFLCTTIFSFSSASQPGPLVEILNWLALSNSMFNPFIYAMFYSWFRSAFRMIVSGRILFCNLTNSNLL